MKVLLMMMMAVVLNAVQVNRPSIPTNFHSTTAASTFIILTWSQPTGEVVDSYNISYSCHPVRAPPIDVYNGSMSVDGSLRCYNLTDALHESMYNISITARNKAGSSAPAEIVVYTPIAPTAPLAVNMLENLKVQMNRPSIPTNFHSTTAASTFIILTWSQPTREVVDSYNISYSYHPLRAPPIDVSNGSMSVNGSLRCYNLTDAMHESMYNISITARNKAGSSAPAEIVVYTPIASTSPLTVENLTVQTPADSVVENSGVENLIAGSTLITTCLVISLKVL